MKFDLPWPRPKGKGGAQGDGGARFHSGGNGEFGSDLSFLCAPD